MALQNNRRICIVTGSRADYGHLIWLLREIDDDASLELQLIATGTHLDDAFGATYQEIERDGFTIDARVELSQSDDTRNEVTKAMGRGMIGFADAYKKLDPDIVVVLGDRFEIFSAAAAALMADIPIAHIHGGEVTEGAIDDSLRHAITKMAHVHFAATQDYANRIAQMGEAPGQIYTVGTPGLDNMDRLDLPNRATLERDLGFALGKAYILVTLHPETIGQDDATKTSQELVSALEIFSDHTILITGVNADPDHRSIKKCLETFAENNPTRVLMRASLGTRRYFAAMKYCACVVGNSSSGIIEAPALNIPTINIGNRQKGRLRSASIIDCAAESTVIEKAIKKALSPIFQASLEGLQPPYGRSGASKSIKDYLKQIDLRNVLRKRFNDIEPAKAALYGS
ncbi:UDP-N-acetylglucosamine 2-epimerase [bacterium]|nr:UDP-N-acetylglucosamine 2-epimerase [bacterium]